MSIRQLPFLFLAALFVSLPVSLGARTIYLSPSGDDSSPVAHGSVFRTVFAVLGKLEAGDTLIVRNGVYLGGLIVNINGTPEAPILIRGESLDAVIDSSRNGLDAIRLDRSSHVIVDRLTIRRANRAGLGIVHCNHITVTNCRMADNGKWGIFTGFVDDFHAEGNECYGAKDEHGIYHSNSGDRFVIRGNILRDNAANGIHLNGDPVMGGDGVMNFGLIEKNIIYRNGSPKGGAGINMTHVQDILVRNNLLYDNYAGGFTVYQDDGTFEQGSKRVVITGNTCVFRPGNGRNVVNIQTTSEKVVVAGNILVSKLGSYTLQVDSDHVGTIRSDWNLHWSPDTSRLVTVKGRAEALLTWGRANGNERHSIVAPPNFNNPDSGDFTLASDSPAIGNGVPPDSLRAMLQGLGGFEWLIGLLDSLPREDIRGTWRPVGESPDAGAYEHGITETQRFDFDGDRLIGPSDAPAMVRMILAGSDDWRLDFNTDGRVGVLDTLAMILALRQR